MPTIKVSKESLEPKPSVPDGLYEVRLEGFEPKWSKDRNSKNLNPVIKIVNNPQFTGSRIYDNLNTGADWILTAFVHSFGLDLVPDGNGDFNIPGDFNGTEDNPEGWSYSGPLTGCVAKVFVKQTTYQNKTNAKVDQWMCAVPGCQKKHPTGLAK